MMNNNDTNLLKFNEFVQESYKSAIVSLITVPIPSSIVEDCYKSLIDKGHTLSILEKSIFRVYIKEGVKTDTTTPRIFSIQETAKLLRKMFPKYSRIIMENSGVHDYLQILSMLYEQGFNKATLLVDESVTEAVRQLANKFNRVKSRHGFFNYKEGVTVIPVKTNGKMITKRVDTLLESMKSKNSISEFIPEQFTDKASITTINTKIRNYLGLRPQWESKETNQSELRENYLAKKIFNVNDLVKPLKGNSISKIIHRGNNYVIVEDVNTFQKTRYWLDAITPV